MNKEFETLITDMKAAVYEEMMCRECSDTSDNWHTSISPENVNALISELERLQGATSPEMALSAIDVLAERQRQISVEGWTPSHDDQYMHSEMAVAATCYIMAGDDPYADIPELWPWPTEWWRPTNIRRDLVKAGALILAEIERLDRASCRQTDKEQWK